MPTPGNWSLGRRITALCATVAIVLGVIAMSAAITATENRGDVNHLLLRLGPARTDAERLMTAVVSQQAGIHGYALSGNADELTQYHDGLRLEQSLLDEIQRLLPNEPAVLAQVDAVRALTTAWRDEITEPLITTVRANGPDPAQSTTSQRARSSFDGITDAVAALVRTLADRRVVLAGQITSASNMLILLLFSAAVVVILAGIALVLLLRQLVTRPVVELAAEVRQVARGDYQREIHGEGPPELIDLAHDVDLMRRRIADDLTEVRAARRQVEEVNRQLEEQAAELTRSNRDLEQFAYVASHDLQEPLRKVASFCQLLQRRYAGQLDDRADQYIAFAVDGAQRMQRLINDLLAFSRIGRLTTGFVDVDLAKVTADAAGQLDARREESGAEITWADLPTVRGEEPLLLALITNLISNSIKFRRPDLPPRIHLSAQRVDGEWEVSCRDNGIGISKDYADKVFVIFQRLHAKETYPGTGIGLAIAKKIIEYHSGRIWLDTEYGDGALIRFTLPVTESPAVDPAEPALTAEPQATAEPADADAAADELVPAAAVPAATAASAAPEEPRS